MKRPTTGILFGMADDEIAFSKYNPAQYEVDRARRGFSIVTDAKRPIIHAFSRWGKTASAATAAIMIDRFRVTRVIHIGLAGSLGTGPKPGDVVLVSKSIHRDLDLKGVMGLDKSEVPILNRTKFASDRQMLVQAHAILKKALNSMPRIGDSEVDPNLYVGVCGTGDTFVEDAEMKPLVKEYIDMICVDMETASIAQVCYEFKVPFLAVKIISEKETTLKSFAFTDWVENYSSILAAEIAECLVKEL